MKRRHLLDLAVAALACAGPHAVAEAAPPAPRPAAATPPDCAMPAGWDQVAARRPRYVIFGEIHGTQEAPAFVATVACALAAQGKRVLVAVEQNTERNQAYQAAWALSQPQFGPALKAAGWKGRDDGIGSEAMFAMLDRLHALKERGRAIHIVAFNGTNSDAQRARFKSLPGQGGHEAAQAENIRVAAEAGAYDYVLVITGNLHARKREIARGGFAFEPMAMQLAPADRIVSLNLATAGGTAWNCQRKEGVQPRPDKPLSDDAIECAVHPYKATLALDRPPFMSLLPVTGIDPDPAYDGIFWVGTVHGSKPAVP